MQVGAALPLESTIVKNSGSAWSHREILERSLFTVSNGQRRGCCSRGLRPCILLRRRPGRLRAAKRCNDNSHFHETDLSDDYESFPSSLHEEESLLSGVSPLGMHEDAPEAPQGWHVRFKSPSGLGDVQEQDALKALGNFGKPPLWLGPCWIELAVIRTLIMYPTAIRRPFLPSIVERGPRPRLLVFLCAII